MSKKPYKEGDWFAVPIEQGYVLGRIARVSRKGGILIGYLYETLFSEIPTLQDTVGFGAADAFYISQFGDLGISKNGWPLLSNPYPWNRLEWPLPPFGGALDNFNGYTGTISYYDDNDPATTIRHQNCTLEQALRLPQDRLSGHISLQNVLALYFREKQRIYPPEGRRQSYLWFGGLPQEEIDKLAELAAAPPEPEPPTDATPEVLHKPLPGLRAFKDKPMDTTQFWKIVEATKKRAKGDPDAQAEACQAHLATLPLDDIAAFDAILVDLLKQADRWDLWGASAVINGGSSEDGFLYFRGWLIGQGEATFAKALQDPDSLADVKVDDVAENEELLYAARAAYEEKAGAEMPTTTIISAPADPAGAPWEEADLPSLLPRLWAKYGSDES